MGFRSQACVIIRNSRHGQTPVFAKECTCESRDVCNTSRDCFSYDLTSNITGRSRNSNNCDGISSVRGGAVLLSVITDVRCTGSSKVRHSGSCKSCSHAHVDMPAPMQKDDDF